MRGLEQDKLITRVSRAVRPTGHMRYRVNWLCRTMTAQQTGGSSVWRVSPGNGCWKRGRPECLSPGFRLTWAHSITIRGEPE
jgi:hypothetical protein